MVLLLISFLYLVYKLDFITIMCLEERVMVHVGLTASRSAVMYWEFENLLSADKRGLLCVF